MHISVTTILDIPDTVSVKEAIELCGTEYHQAAILHHLGCAMKSMVRNDATSIVDFHNTWADIIQGSTISITRIKP
jgi:hypothetical protein